MSTKAPTAASPPDATAWTDHLLADNPHAVPDKARRVERMFAAIAGRYDLNNRLHSFGRDQAWRRATVALADLQPGDAVVDVACGTGDLTFAFADAHPDQAAARITGIDFTFEMLQQARRKEGRRQERPRPQPRPGSHFARGDGMGLPLPDGCCDVLSIAFGIRNIVDPDQALREFYRVLRPGGRLLVLEFSEPKFAPARWFNRLYCGRIMPLTATWIAGDRSGAYKYLPRSVSAFLSRDQMTTHLQTAGFQQITQHPLTFGVAVCYRGLKCVS